jgi:hypothetical protein
MRDLKQREVLGMLTMLKKNLSLLPAMTVDT